MATVKASEISDYLVDLINQRDVEGLNHTLESIVGQLHQLKTIDKVIQRLLLVATETHQDNIIKIVIDFANYYTTEVSMEYTAKLFYKPIYNVDFLYRLYESLKETSYVEIVTEIISKGARNQQDLYAIIRVDEVFGLQSKDTYSSLIEYCLEVKEDPSEEIGSVTQPGSGSIDYVHYNFYVLSHLKKKLAVVSEFAPIPPFVGDFRSVEDLKSSLERFGTPLEETLQTFSKSNRLYLEEQLSGKVSEAYVHISSILPTEDKLYEAAKSFNYKPHQALENYISMKNLDQVVDMIIKVIKGEEIDFEDEDFARQSIRTSLLTGSNDDRHSILQSIMNKEEINNFYDDETILSLLGPLHSMYGEIISDLDDMESDCKAFGGCRYYLCNCLEKDEFGVGDELPISDLYWFKGYCSVCSRRIKANRHAYRLPGKKGGWYGCYCSPACIRKDIYEDDINTRMLLDGFLELLSKSSIQDCEDSEISL